MFNTDCPLESCHFDKVASSLTLSFEWFVIILTLIVLGLLYRKNERKLLKRFGLLMIGVLIFEVFTQPLWNNHHMSQWTYLYADVSWILTFGWTLILFLSSLVTEKLFHPGVEWKKFAGTLTLSFLFGLLGEALVLWLGVRSYSPEVQSILSGMTIGNVPIEAVFYMPVFMALVLSFMEYWELVFGNILIAPHRRIVNWRSFTVAFIGVFLYEIMNEPAVGNVGWPAWSYIYQDVNLIRIVLWVLVLAACAQLTQHLFYKQSPGLRFGIALFFITIVTIPIENWLVSHGMRVYSESLQAGFYGLKIPGTQLPTEILVAVPLYASLIIPFVRYWVAVWEKDL